MSLLEKELVSGVAAAFGGLPVDPPRVELGTYVKRPHESRRSPQHPFCDVATLETTIGDESIALALVVEGYVEASMDSRVIEISETGVYKGTVEIDTAIVRGHFEGELTARERLIVHTTGDVSGKIRYGSLAIEEGGAVFGDVHPIGEGKLEAQQQDDQKPKPNEAA